MPALSQVSDLTSRLLFREEATGTAPELELVLVMLPELLEPELVVLDSLPSSLLLVEPAEAGIAGEVIAAVQAVAFSERCKRA